MSRRNGLGKVFERGHNGGVTQRISIADFVCWQCGTSLVDVTLPLARLDECPRCRAYLHVCKLCAFYARDVTKQCREDDAEEVLEKTRANFCEYFKPRGGAYAAAAHDKAESAKAKLNTLFGADKPQEDNDTDAARKKLEELFRGK